MFKHLIILFLITAIAVTCPAGSFAETEQKHEADFSQIKKIIEQGMALNTPDERAAMERKWLSDSDIRTKDTLTIAMGNDYPPLFFVNEQGEPAGMFTDIWRLWSKKTGEKIEFHPETFNDAINSLKIGETDVHIGLIKSPERETWVDFYDVLYEAKMSVFYSIHYGRFSNINELSGHPVGAVKGTVQEKFLKEKYPSINTVPYESLRDMILAARDGKIHAFAAVNVLTTEMISRLGVSGEFESTGEVLFPTIYSVAIRKGNPELYVRIQKGFEAITNPELSEIENRWIRNPDFRYFSSKIQQIKLTSDEKAWIEKHRIVNFGISTGFAPFTFTGKDGKPDGMVMDYLRLLQNKTGIEFKVDVAKPWTDLMPLIQGNAIDGVAFASRTAEREKSLLFTDNYIVKHWVIVTRNDFKGIDLKLSDLEGIKVAVMETSPVEETLRQYPNIRLVSFPTVEQIWDAVSMGETDAACSSLSSASYYISKKGITNLKVAGIIEDRLKLSSCIRKDLPELVNILNKAIAVITPEEHQTIEKKWMSLRYEMGVDWKTVRRWIVLIVLISGIVVVLTLLWNRKLAEEVETRRRVEDSLRNTSERMKDILESISDAFFSTDDNLVVTYFNAAAERILNRKASEVAGKYLFDAFPEAKGSIFQEKFNLALKEKKFLTFETYFDEEPYRNWYDMRVYPQKNGISVYFQIVTERKHAEEEQAKLKQQLAQAQKMEAIGMLAGGIAHDFNNMLAVIAGNISYAVSQIKGNDKLFEILTDVQTGTRQAQTLTQQLLTFAKGGEPIKKTVRISDVIKETAIFITRGSKVRCEFIFPDDLWSVAIDMGQINQAISNIVINGMQAMPGGGLIQIQTENVVLPPANSTSLPPGNYVKISIKDEGIGISEKHIAKIFDLYFTTKQKGRGLGLSTTYSIIKKHNGHISVESVIDKGTTFYIYLPSTGTAIFDEPKAEAVQHKGQGKILLMDDQEAVLKMAGRLFGNMGYETALAMDGRQAIKMYKDAFQSQHPFDIVILDLTVPGGMGGAETIPELIKIDPKVKAIVSSGYSNDPVMANYKAYGFCSVMPKPYTIAEVEATFNKIFSKIG